MMTGIMYMTGTFASECANKLQTVRLEIDSRFPRALVRFIVISRHEIEIR